MSWRTLVNMDNNVLHAAISFRHFWESDHVRIRICCHDEQTCWLVFTEWSLGSELDTYTSYTQVLCGPVHAHHQDNMDFSYRLTWLLSWTFLSLNGCWQGSCAVWMFWKSIEFDFSSDWVWISMKRKYKITCMFSGSILCSIISNYTFKNHTRWMFVTAFGADTQHSQNV